MLLGKEKARLKDRNRHASWLRIYAIKLEPGIYVITGGAIKLTRTMQEREHTLLELDKMEEMHMTQKHLAELMGCSQQYVSKVLKGQENLSLETMAKIEDCLEISILRDEMDMAMK